jgi:hypothetical protein
MKTVTGGSCAVLLALILMMDGHALNAAASCERLSSLALPNTSITLAQMVPAGGFSLPGTGPAAVQQFSQLPAFCRVAATLTPSSDSDIRLIASRVSDNRVNMRRPVCPYPQVAQYTGVGSTNDAANFVCKVR